MLKTEHGDVKRQEKFVQLFGGISAWGGLLLFVCLKKQTNNTNNKYTYLNQIRVCNHHGQPSSLLKELEGKEAPSKCEGRPPTVLLVAPLILYQKIKIIQ